MAKWFRAVATAVALALQVAPAALAQEINLRVASYAPEGDVMDMALTKLNEELMTRSGGKMGLTVFRSNTLGTIRESIELAKRGNVDFAVAGAPNLAPFAPAIGITSFPYLWQSRDNMISVLNSDLGDELKSIVEQQAPGLKVMTWWLSGFRSVTNNSRPIMSPDDIKGLKLRVVPTPVQLAFWAALGAIPTPMDWAEVIPALQQNVIDGQENPPTVIYPYHVYEFQKFYSLTNHSNEPTLLLMSQASWDKLSDENKKILTDALEAVRPYQYELAEQQNTELMEKLKPLIAINEVPEETRNAFRQAAASVYEVGMESLKSDEARALVQKIIDVQK